MTDPLAQREGCDAEHRGKRWPLRRRQPRQPSWLQRNGGPCALIELAAIFLDALPIPGRHRPTF